MHKRLSRQQIIIQAMPEIEAEHKRLFALSWQYFSALKSNGNGNRRHSLELFNGILDHARVHFAHEEAVLEEAVHPRYVLHQQAHRQILIGLTQFLWGRTADVAAVEYLHALDALLVHHIREDTISLIFSEDDV